MPWWMVVSASLVGTLGLLVLLAALAKLIRGETGGPPVNATLALGLAGCEYRALHKPRSFPNAAIIFASGVTSVFGGLFTIVVPLDHFQSRTPPPMKLAESVYLAIFTLAASFVFLSHVRWSDLNRASTIAPPSDGG